MDYKKSMRLGEILKNLRKKYNFTQDFVASQLNLSRSTYTYYETGKTEPNLKSLGILSKLYNVDLETFLMDQKSFNLADSNTSKKNKSLQVGINALTPEERKLIALFRVSDDAKRKKLLTELIENKNKT